MWIVPIMVIVLAILLLHVVSYPIVLTLAVALCALELREAVKRP